MNEFSIICRVLGSLFYRHPEDAALAPLIELIKSGKLYEHWPLEQQEQLTQLQQSCDLNALAADFNALFVGQDCHVPATRSAYIEASSELEVREFLLKLGMPLGEGPADSFGSLLLAASWLEDHALQEQDIQQQIILFDHYLLPWSARFLGKVEAYAGTLFYRVLAAITRDALQLMRDELEEDK